MNICLLGNYSMPAEYKFFYTMPAFASTCSVLNHQFEETSIPPYYDTAGYRCEQLNCGHPMNMSFRRAFWTIPSRLAAGVAKTAPAIFQHNMCPDRT